MILLYIETKQYMYEDHDLEKVLDAAGEAVRNGKAVQIIPGGTEGSSRAEQSLEQRTAIQEQEEE